MIRFFVTAITLIGLFCMAGPLWGKIVIPQTIVLESMVKPDTNENPCNLPAPAGFRVTGVGAGKVALAWAPVEGAQAYYVMAIDANNQTIVDRQAVTATSATMNIPYGGTFNFTVAAWVGELCPPSTNLATIPGYIGPIIAELIDLGYSAGNCNNAPPSQPACLSFPVQSSSRWYNILQGQSVIGRFQIEIVHTPGSFPRVRIGEDDAMPYVKTKYYDYVESKMICIPSDDYYYAVVTSITFGLTCADNPSQDLFKMYFPLGDPEQILICFEYLNSAITLGLATECWILPNGHDGEDGANPGGRSASADNNLLQPRVTNPFSDHLHIAIPEGGQSPVRFQLFNLNGQLLLDQQFPARQEYNLPTADLPSGFYLLRIDAGGSKQTYKVVKTQ